MLNFWVMKVRSNQQAKTAEIASELLSRLIPGERATILGLRGDLGAGKTTFTQSLAEALGVKEKVTSPTFVIMKVYQLPREQKFQHLVHIDCYRLESSKELDHLGFEELTEDPGNLIILEWPEKVAEILPPQTKFIDFEFIDELSRDISYDD